MTTRMVRKSGMGMWNFGYLPSLIGKMGNLPTAFIAQ
jgi:hypothetical protein